MVLQHTIWSYLIHSTTSIDSLKHLFRVLASRVPKWDESQVLWITAIFLQDKVHFQKSRRMLFQSFHNKIVIENVWLFTSWRDSTERGWYSLWLFQKTSLGAQCWSSMIPSSSIGRLIPLSLKLEGVLSPHRHNVDQWSITDHVCFKLAVGCPQSSWCQYCLEMRSC